VEYKRLEDKCIICGEPLEKRGILICGKCKGKGWIDCKAEKEKNKKQALAEAEEVLHELVEAAK